MVQSKSVQQTAETPLGAWRTTYTPGSWVALSGPMVLLILPPAPSDKAGWMNDLWVDCVQAPSVTGLIEVLSAYNVLSMPHLGIFFWDEAGMHTLVRGLVKVKDDTTGEIIASGEGVSTWREVGLGEVTRVRIDLEEFNISDVLYLPLMAGGATVSSLVLDSTRRIIPTLPKLKPTQTQTSIKVAAESDETVEVAEVVELDEIPEREASHESKGILDAELVDDPDLMVAPEPTQERGQILENESIAARRSGEELSSDNADSGVFPVPARSAAEPESALQPQAEQIQQESVPQPKPWWELDESSLTPEPAPVAPESVFPEPQTSVVPEPISVVPGPVLPEQVPTSRDLGAHRQPNLQDQYLADQYPAIPYSTDRYEATQQAVDRLGISQSATGQHTTSQLGASQFDSGQYQTDQAHQHATDPYGQSEQTPHDIRQADHRQDQYELRQYDQHQYGQPQQPDQPQITDPQIHSYPTVPEQQTEPAQQIRYEQQVGAGRFIPQSSFAAEYARPTAQEVNHDGGTIFSTGIAATHKPSGSDRADTGLLLAAFCQRGHANAPGSLRCRVCGQVVDSSNPKLISKPVLGILQTSTGETIELVKPVLIGRAPAPSSSDGNAGLLKVPSPSQDISRTHVRISPSEWNIEVTDLHSTNGTIVLLPREEPIRLESGETVTVDIGAVVDIGDGVTIRIMPPF